MKLDSGEQPVFRVHPESLPASLRLEAITDLDAASEEQAEAELRAALDRHPATECVVDVSRVFVDVRGYTVLVTGAAHAQARDIRFAVVPSRSVRTMSRVPKVGSLLTLIDDPAQSRGEPEHPPQA